MNTQDMDERACVVVSHWVGHDLEFTRRLMRQMHNRPSGYPFDLVIVCNGGSITRDDVPQMPQSIGVTLIDRENQGYNIGAWDAGWRAMRGYGHYLFLQDECTLRRSGWLEAFVTRHKALGDSALIGEALMWADLDWETLTEQTRRDFPSSDVVNSIDTYRQLLKEMAIPEGPVATHLQSLVLFADGVLLERMDGFPTRSAYREAVACEIGISRKAASLGAHLLQLDPQRKFTAIAHPEWVGLGPARKAMLRRWHRLKGKLKRALSPMSEI